MKRWGWLLLALLSMQVLTPIEVRAGEPYGAIGAKYAQLGGRSSSLGAPVGDEHDAAYDGRCQQFERGVICWHPTIGAAAVWGGIGAKYLQLGGPEYGYPITDESSAGDGRGRYNDFRAVHAPQSGALSIYWSSQTGAHAIYGAIRATWLQGGGVQGSLGYPISDEYQDGRNRRSDFEHGSIFWSAESGAWIVPQNSPATPTYSPPPSNGSDMRYQEWCVSHQQC